MYSTCRLPLRLLPPLECLQYCNLLLQWDKPFLCIFYDLALIIAQFHVKVFPIGRGRHCGTENRFDQETMVRLQCVAVGCPEWRGEFFAWIFQVCCECLGCEVETAVENDRDAVSEVLIDRERAKWKGLSCYRTSHTKPSAAVCFLLLISFTTSDWRVIDSEGVASCLSRTFCGSQFGQ